MRATVRYGSSAIAALSLLLAASGPALAQGLGLEATFDECQDGLDNDRDGAVDCADPLCADFIYCAPCGRPGAPTAAEDTQAACSDGQDNDCDGNVDCADPGCADLIACAAQQATPPATTPENTPAACGDGVDNDGDGHTDCADQDCSLLVHCAQQRTAPAQAQPAQEQPAQAQPARVQPARVQPAQVQQGLQQGPAVRRTPPPRPPAPVVMRVRITSEAEGAQLTVDGEARGRLPWEGALAVGHHAVSVEAEGYRTRRQDLEVTPRTGEVAVELTRRGQLDIGLFTLGLAVQVPFFFLSSEVNNTSSVGASFALRTLFAAVRRPVLLDLGLELAGGHMTSPDGLVWDHHGLDFFVDDDAYRGGRFFQLGFYLGLGVPLVVRDRPYLYLTMNVTNGFSAVPPVRYYLNAAVGLSYFVSDLVELRFELLGIELRGIMASAEYFDGEDQTNETGVSLWMVHLMPALALHLRF